jgi:hypothetical protein
LRIHASVRIVGFVQRSLARKLVALLILLALIAGGDRFAMAMTMEQRDAPMSDMQKPDMSCKACGATMAGAPCDAACSALPAIAAAIDGVPDARGHERWPTRSESIASLSVKPNTSPPRA